MLSEKLQKLLTKISALSDLKDANVRDGMTGHGRYDALELELNDWLTANSSSVVGFLRVAAGSADHLSKYRGDDTMIAKRLVASLETLTERPAPIRTAEPQCANCASWRGLTAVIDTTVVRLCAEHSNMPKAAHDHCDKWSCDDRLAGPCEQADTLPR